MTPLRHLLASYARSEQDPQPGRGLSNRRRIAVYEQLIAKAQEQAEAAGTVAARRAHLKLIARLDARCRRELRRREDATRS